jgi:phage protein D
MAPTATVSDFKIRFGGSAIPLELKARMEQIEVDLKLNVPAMFALTFSDPGWAWANDDAIQFGKEVDIEIGALGSTKPIVNGLIVGIEVDTTRTGAPEVNIRGFEKLHKLTRSKGTRTFLNQKDSDIVRSILSEHGLSAEFVDEPSIKHQHVYQHNQTDLEFVQSLAARNGLVLYFSGNKATFKRRDYKATPVAELVMGQNLLAFRPRLTTAKTASKVEVRGWDAKSKKFVTATAQEDQSKAKGLAAADVAGALAKVTQISMNVEDAESAEQAAKAAFSKGVSGFITALCEVQGNPDLRPGEDISVQGVGKRMSGSYYITSVRHRYGKKGFLSLVTAQRSVFEEPAPPPKVKEAGPAEEELVDIEDIVVDSLGEAIPDASYVITLSDGSKREGKTDSEGKVIQSGVPKGGYKIELADYDVSIESRTEGS